MRNKTFSGSFFVSMLALFSSILLTASASAQSLHPLEPIVGNYKQLASISSAPNPQKAYLDTIVFPWSEYSEFALASTLMRTVYMGKEDEAMLLQKIRFPANSSDQTRAELDYLLKLQNNRTKEAIDRALFIGNVGVWPTLINPIDSNYKSNLAQLFYIASPVGDWYNHQNFPATTQLLLNCIQDIRVTEFRLKKHFKRARPYHLEPNLQPLARMQSPSFASGHTLWAFAQALVFSEIIPEKRGAFLNLAEEVRWSRELMGIHYPSDNEASRVIAWELLRYWNNNPQFVNDLQRAKEEWKTKQTVYVKQ